MTTDALGRGVRWLHWYLREVSGESAYDRHVAHLRSGHPGAPVPTRKEFERWRMDQRDSRPEARCC
jgi:uncharacterized short protein YbdD (DUF466 family)